MSRHPIYTEEWLKDKQKVRAEGRSVKEQAHGPYGTLAAHSPSKFGGYRSELEQAYARKLDMEKLAGTIVDWRYEPFNYRLPGEKNFYKVDFMFWERYITFVEIKGWSQSFERSLVKLKTAAGLHPWARWIQVTQKDGEWKERAMR